jgi:GNAT superfamily N-acetyltransferase
VRLISLVAEADGRIVGHILFSPVSLAQHPELNVMGLGPMAVVPPYQRQGIGSALVREGLKQCEQLGCHAVVVVGHPHYYHLRVLRRLPRAATSRLVNSVATAVRRSLRRARLPSNTLESEPRVWTTPAGSDQRHTSG